MEENKNLQPEEKAELKRLKKEILARRDVFESYDFYMPEFEAAVNSIPDIQSCKFIIWTVERQSKGTQNLSECVPAEMEFYLGELFSRLALSPFPQKVLEYYKENVEANKFRGIQAYHEGEKDLEKWEDLLYPDVPKEKRMTEEYKRAVNGRDSKLADAFRTGISYRFRNAEFQLFYDAGEWVEEIGWLEKPLVNPKVFNDIKELICAFGDVMEAISQYGSAHLEALILKIESMLNAGKSVAEIRAELFPETEGEGNLKNLETPAPEPSPQPAETELPTETQKPVLSVLETVLLHFYQRAPMTRETAENIAKECSEPAGRIYSPEYVFKIVRECNKPETRQQRGKGKRAKENRLQILKRLKEYLPENPILEEDIRTVTTAKNKAKK